MPRDEYGGNAGDFVIADRKKVEAIYDRIRKEATARADRDEVAQTAVGELERATKENRPVCLGKLCRRRLVYTLDGPWTYCRVGKRIGAGISNGQLQSFELEIFLVPMPSVQEFRDGLKAKLGLGA